MLVCVCVSIRVCLFSVVRIDIKDRCYLLTVNDDSRSDIRLDSIASGTEEAREATGGRR